MAIESVTTETIAEMAAARLPEPEAKAEEVKQDEPEGDQKVKKPIQERISELTAQKRELEQFWRSEYEARLQAQNRVKELETLAPKPPENKRPDRTAYKPEEAEKYENDLLEWNRKQAIAEFQAAESERRTREALAERTERARRDIPDFDEVIQSADRRGQPIPPHVVAAITESDVGPKLAYHLAKNQDEAKRIFGMTPAKALLALGKLETTYADAKESAPVVVPQPATKPPVTKAPAPLPSLNTGAGNVITDAAQAPDFNTYKRLRLEEMRKRRG